MVSVPALRGEEAEEARTGRPTPPVRGLPRHHATARTRTRTGAPIATRGRGPWRSPRAGSPARSVTPSPRRPAASRTDRTGATCARPAAAIVCLVSSPSSSATKMARGDDTPLGPVWRGSGRRFWHRRAPATFGPRALVALFKRGGRADRRIRTRPMTQAPRHRHPQYRAVLDPPGKGDRGRPSLLGVEGFDGVRAGQGSSTFEIDGRRRGEPPPESHLDCACERLSPTPSSRTTGSSWSDRAPRFVSSPAPTATATSRAPWRRRAPEGRARWHADPDWRPASISPLLPGGSPTATYLR